jgi:hypothetical protein
VGEEEVEAMSKITLERNHNIKAKRYKGPRS